MLLPQGIEQGQRPTLLDVPEGPAVARWRALQRGADLVNRTRMRFANDRAVGPHRGRPAPLGVRQPRAGANQPIFDQHTEGDPRLVALEASGFAVFTVMSFAAALYVLRREG